MNGDAGQRALGFPLARIGTRPARLAPAPTLTRSGAARGPVRRAAREEAFHELLAIERARAGRAGRPLRLLHVSLKPGLGQAVEIKPAVADRFFAGLAEALRETDVIGWHREGRVAGAVLVEAPGRQGQTPSPRSCNASAKCLRCACLQRSPASSTCAWCGWVGTARRTADDEWRDQRSTMEGALRRA